MLVLAPWIPEDFGITDFSQVRPSFQRPTIEPNVENTPVSRLGAAIEGQGLWYGVDACFAGRLRDRKREEKSGQEMVMG